MKLKQTLIGIVPCLAFALTGYAQTTTTFDWTFSSTGNPKAPDGAPPVNPFLANATATITGDKNSYWFTPYQNDPGTYGSPSGLWDIQAATSQGPNGGGMTLTLDKAALTTVNYTLVVKQFNDTQGFLPGNLTFTGPGVSAVHVDHSAIPNTSGTVGQWFQDTYTWSGVSGQVVLSILPDTSANTPEILLDQVTFTIDGVLTAVPEPSTVAMLASGLLALVAGSHYRRKVKG